MSSVVISGNTSGTITLDAPAVAGTTTLTLPATSGTVIVNSGAQTIEFADGSASTPSITNSGDTNTGMFFPDGDTMAFAEGGVEAMRIDSSGRLLVGTTDVIGGAGGKLNILQTNTSADIGQVRNSGAAAGRYWSSPYVDSSSTYYIINNDSEGVKLTHGATSWAAQSDVRLKNITGTYTNALSDIAQIQPVKFTWKNDLTNKVQVGVIAQSVLPVVPEAVEALTIPKSEDKTEYLSVRYTELIPLMIASIQELKAELDNVKTELATFKGAA